MIVLGKLLGRYGKPGPGSAEIHDSLGLGIDSGPTVVCDTGNAGLWN